MKKSLLNIYVFVFTLVFSSIISFNTAQAENNSMEQNQEGQVQRRGDAPQLGEGEPLNDAQKAIMVSILSKYDASSLTAKDARAINNAFREAGIRRGAGQKEAIEAAGFNPQTISSLDPPPCGKGQKNNNNSKL